MPPSSISSGSPSNSGSANSRVAEPGVVEDVEEQLAVIVADPRAPADDLLELGHGVDDPQQHHVLAGRHVNAGGEHLRGGEDDGRGALHVLEPAQVAAADAALVGNDPANVVGMLPNQVGVEVVQCPPHFVGVFLVHAEDDRLGEAVGLLEERGQVLGDRLGAGLQRNDPLEVGRLVNLVGNLPAVAVDVALAGPPAGRVPLGDDPMHAVRGQEAVVDALPQAVGVDRVAEVAVGVDVVLPLRRGRHADLVGRLEVFQDFPPVAIVAGAAAVALIDHDQVEEVAGELLVEPRPPLVLGDGLVDGEVHLPAVAQLVFADLDAGVAEGGEGLVLGVIDQHVAVGQVENLGPAVLARAVPARRPELPADLEGHERLARAGGHRQSSTRRLPSRIARTVRLMAISW